MSTDVIGQPREDKETRLRAYVLFHPRVVVRDHGRDLRLLEHDLGHPDLRDVRQEVIIRGRYEPHMLSERVPLGQWSNRKAFARAYHAMYARRNTTQGARDGRGRVPRAHG